MQAQVFDLFKKLHSQYLAASIFMIFLCASILCTVKRIFLWKIESIKKFLFYLIKNYVN